MYKTFYGLEINPFVKELKTEYCYESKDYNEVKGRLKYLKEIKGIGLFIGSSGLGKTYSIRCFTESLNKDLYKVIYISPTKKMRVFEFFVLILTLISSPGAIKTSLPFLINAIPSPTAPPKAAPPAIV